jgi:hypothetical protein
VKGQAFCQDAHGEGPEQSGNARQLEISFCLSDLATFLYSLFA